MNFRKELEGLLNSCSQENGSNTPDFILANYLSACLVTFDGAVNARERWYGREIGWRGGIPDYNLDWHPAPEGAIAPVELKE